MQLRALVTLTPSESKRLIALGVCKLPVVSQARITGKVIVSPGTTNAYVAEELLGESIEKSTYFVGIINKGTTCLADRQAWPGVHAWENGQISKRPWTDILDEFSAGDVFVKGANAIDNSGNAGILLANPTGGFIARAMGVLFSRGASLVIPVGLEKLIPSVEKAAKAGFGLGSTDISMGQRVGYMSTSQGLIITEIEALEILAGVEATCIAAGGAGDSTGSVVLSIEGDDSQVQNAIHILKSVKGEPALAVAKRKCTACPKPCDYPADQDQDKE
jgi:hypothetical protein